MRFIYIRYLKETTTKEIKTKRKRYITHTRARARNRRKKSRKAKKEVSKAQSYIDVPKRQHQGYQKGTSMNKKIALKPLSKRSLFDVTKREHQWKNGRGSNK